MEYETLVPSRWEVVTESRWDLIYLELYYDGLSVAYLNTVADNQGCETPVSHIKYFSTESKKPDQTRFGNSEIRWYSLSIQGNGARGIGNLKARFVPLTHGVSVR